MKNKSALEVFDVWAKTGKDLGMEKGHSKSGDRIIKLASEKVKKKNNELSILDIGCGNGWMTRRAGMTFMGSKFLGVDGSRSMIENARNVDTEGDFICKDLNHWNASNKFGLVISMEVIYYIEDPLSFLTRLCTMNVCNGGVVVFGLDHYAENKSSLLWPQDLGVNMKTYSIDQWIEIFRKAGFSRVAHEQFGADNNWAGTLIISALK